MALTFASRPGADAARGFFRRFSRNRDLDGLGPVLARSGALEARLATTKKDVRRAQKLRYRVFFEEGGATPDPTARIIRRDVCRFDGVSDHLIVVDSTLRHRDGSPKCVGVYRLLRQEVAERNFGFCSALEFDVEPLFVAPSRDPVPRTQPRLHRPDPSRAACARTSVARALGLRAPPPDGRDDRLREPARRGRLRPCPRDPGAGGGKRRSVMARRAAARAGRPFRRGPTSAPPADPRALMRTLPPLVKGYWRLGATFSPMPAVDPAFNTTDVFVVDAAVRHRGALPGLFRLPTRRPRRSPREQARGQGIPFRAEFVYGRNLAVFDGGK